MCAPFLFEAIPFCISCIKVKGPISFKFINAIARFYPDEILEQSVMEKLMDLLHQSTIGWGYAFTSIHLLRVFTHAESRN